MSGLDFYPKEEIFRVWAPQESIWSQWVKPVLFASMDFLFPPAKPERVEVDLAGISEGDQAVAYVFDLPGASGVWASSELMKKGLRPVPLYNALASPLGSISSYTDEGVPIVSRVDVVPIVSALWHLAAEVQGLALGPAAPPAFLLDSNRATGNPRVPSSRPEPAATPTFTFEWNSAEGDGEPEVGDFDNRSVSFPTDFPSANLLLSRNIQRVIVVQNAGSQPQEDLAHTLRRWQDAGIRIELKALNAPGPPTLCVVEKPSQFRGVFYQILAKLGFQTSNRFGGFGRMINEFASG
jgi:hypothetical protein